MRLMTQVRSIWVPTNETTFLCLVSGILMAIFFTPRFIFRSSLFASAFILVLFPAFSYNMLRICRWFEEICVEMTADVVADRRTGFLFPAVLAATGGFILGRIATSCLSILKP